MTGDPSAPGGRNGRRWGGRLIGAGLLALAAAWLLRLGGGDAPDAAAQTAVTAPAAAPVRRSTAPEPAAPVRPPPVPARPSELTAPRRGRRAVLALLLAPARLGPAPWRLFGGAAVALGVAGYFHGHLYHEGYGQVPVVGPLFFLNVIGTAAVILMLLAGRAIPFALGALSIGLGAIVSIVIAHSSSFFGFAESGYQTTAVVIVVAEAATVVLVVAGLWLARGALRAGMAAR